MRFKLAQLLRRLHLITGYWFFLEQLRQTPRDWEITEFGKIRLRGLDLVCPLVAVYNKPMHSSDLYQSSFARDVWHAADHFKPFNPRIRQTLLRATGLCERKDIRFR